MGSGSSAAQAGAYDPGGLHPAPSAADGAAVSFGLAARRLPFRHAPVCGRPDRRLVETAANAALRHIMRREKGEKREDFKN